MNRETVESDLVPAGNRTLRVAAAFYSLAAVLAGLWLWKRPPTYDEATFYLPALDFFADRFPSLPANYPMPMPPLVLYVQGVVWHFLPSLALLRALSTAAVIGAAWVMALVVRRDRPGPAALVLLSAAAFPTLFASAFTLKPHSVVLLCCVGALCCWDRRRPVWTAVLLAAGCATHQMTAAMSGTLALMTVASRERGSLPQRLREAALLLGSALPLAVLTFVWGGPRPPMYGAVFNDPGTGRLYPMQFLVLLLMAGAWLAPAAGAWRDLLRRGLWALPVAIAALHFSGLMRPDAPFLQQIAGPVSTAIEIMARRRYPIELVLAAAVISLGAAFLTNARAAAAVDPVLIWTAAYASLMLFVPFYFESYYGLFVVIAWLIAQLASGLAPSRSVLVFRAAVVLAGFAFLAKKS